MIQLKIEKDSKQLSNEYLESIEKNIAAASSHKLIGEEIKDSQATKEILVSGIVQADSNLANLKDVNIITARNVELQNVLERQSKELAETRLRLVDLQNKYMF